MAIVDSKEQMLELNQLIQDGYENNPDPQLPLELQYPRFVQERTIPNSLFLRYGNTIFIMHGHEKKAGLASMRIINADTDENFVQSLYQCLKDAYLDGFYFLVVRNPDEMFLSALEMVEQQPPHPGTNHRMDEDSDGMSVVGIMIGDPKRTKLRQPVPLDFPPPNNAREFAERIANQKGRAPQGMEAEMGGGQMPPMQTPMSQPPMGGLGQLQNKLTEGEV